MKFHWYTLSASISRVPEELHDKFADLPLAPERMKVPASALNTSAGQTSSKTEKLILGLNDKNEYTVLGQLLALYMEEGLILEKIHWGIRYRQSTLTPI